LLFIKGVERKSFKHFFHQTIIVRFIPGAKSLKKILPSEISFFGLFQYRTPFLAQGLAAEQFHFLRKVVYPASYLSWKVNGRRNTGIDNHSFSPFNEVIGMGNNFLFCCPGHALTGRQPENSAFIGSNACACMALDYSGDFLTDPLCTQEICSPLSMQNRVTLPSADVVEHGTLAYQVHCNEIIAFRVFQCNVTNSLAVGQNFLTASCFTQHPLIYSFGGVRHDQAIS
jgi:hypothetical protein